MLDKQKILGLITAQKVDGDSLENTLAYVQSCLELMAITGENYLAFYSSSQNYMDYDDKFVDAYANIKSKHEKAVKKALTEAGFIVEKIGYGEGFLVGVALAELGDSDND